MDEDGIVTWKNRNTNESRSSRPEGFPNESELVQLGMYHRRFETKLPLGWEKHHDEASGINYYTQTSTGTSQWDKPSGFLLVRNFSPESEIIP